MNKIKFSHEYEKMIIDPHLSTAILMEVFNSDTKDLSELFLRYDTKLKGRMDFYKLPQGKVLILLLKSGSHIFTTIRRWTPEKEKYYRSIRGEQVEIVVEEQK